MASRQRFLCYFLTLQESKGGELMPRRSVGRYCEGCACVHFPSELAFSSFYNPSRGFRFSLRLYI